MTLLLTLVIGLGLLLLGASWLVDAAVAIANRKGIPYFITGAVIVGLGTSLPEIFVAISSSLAGKGDMAVGNVLGSNLCNGMLILGAAIVIRPFKITRSNLRRDIPMAFFTTLLVMLLSFDSILPRISQNEIGRLDGVFLIIVLLCYLGYIIYSAARSNAQADPSKKSKIADRPMWALVAVALVSLVALIAGGEMFLDSAVEAARKLGVSEKLISITLVAVGTSLPELVTCVTAAVKGNPQLAMGNVIGSNILNLLVALGAASLCSPIVLHSVSVLDFGVLLLGSALTFAFAFTFKKNTFDRVEGVILAAIYALYIGYLVS